MVGIVEEFVSGNLDLNSQLIHHPAATFFVRVAGDAMKGASISSGDLLIVDRSLEGTDGKIVIAAAGGQLLVRRLRLTPRGPLLIAEDGTTPPIKGEEFHLWGVVTYVIHKAV